MSDAQARKQQPEPGAAKPGDVPAMLGEYRLQERLARSRTGEIFKARHRTMGRTVALKVLSPQAVASAELAQRFERKIKILAGLSHPHLVAAYEAGQCEGKHYLVMEYVDGRNLWSLVKEGGPLPIDRAVGYILQAAAALGYVHTNGVVHRNVKLSNLMVAGQGVVKLVGFGIAHVEQGSAMDEAGAGGDLTRLGVAMGTAEYVAPEQAVNAAGADRRADIYSLGCTLYALLAGHPPFPGKSAMRVLAAHRSAPIPSLRALRPDVPETLDTVYQRMLAKRPEDRYGSMDEVMVALQAACAQPRANPIAEPLGTPSAAGTGTWSSLTRRARQNRVFLTIIGLGIAVMLLIVLAISGGRSKAPETAEVPPLESRPLAPTSSLDTAPVVRGEGSETITAEGGATHMVAPAWREKPGPSEPATKTLPASALNPPPAEPTLPKSMPIPQGEADASGSSAAAERPKITGKPASDDLVPLGPGLSPANAAEKMETAAKPAERAAASVPGSAAISTATSPASGSANSPSANAPTPAGPEEGGQTQGAKSAHELRLPNTNSALQANLDAVHDYSAELAFVDAMKMAREWVLQKKGSKNFNAGSKSLFSFDAQGYPTVMPEGQFAEAILRWNIQNAFPMGQYVVLYEGRGTIEPGFAAKLVSAAPGRQVWEVSGSFSLRIQATDPKDNIRNIRVVPAAYEKSCQQQPFMPELLEDLKYYKVLRFKDWQRTDDSVNQRWEDRRTPDNSYTQSGKKGVALEYICDLCNRVMTDCWINVPHAADDDFVRNMARLIRDRLDGRLRVYIEYSNETWNTDEHYADQFRWCEQHGAALGSYRGPDGKTHPCNGHQYHAKRSLEIWNLFEKEFGGDTRIVRVMAGQAATPATYQQRLYVVPGVLPRVDAVATSNYYLFGDDMEKVRQRRFDGSTPEGWLKGCRDELAAGCPTWRKRLLGEGSRPGVLAYTQGKIPIINYEGGLSTGVGLIPNFDRDLATAGYTSSAGEWVEASLIFAARPELYEITQQYCEQLMRMHPSVHMLSQFASCSRWDKYGCWGAFNTWKPLGDPRRNDDRYRHRGLIDWVKSHPVPNKAPQVSTAKHLSVRVKSSLQLSARVSDDHARQIGRVNVYWSCVSAPEAGQATFHSPFAAKTTVRFDTPGEYRLQVSANDGWAIGYDQTQVDVKD